MGVTEANYKLHPENRELRLLGLLDTPGCREAYE